MSLTSEDLFEILQAIWSTQLGLELTGDARRSDLIVDPEDRVMTGTVQISGGFAGAVHLVCDRGVIRTAAARMFSVAENELNEEDLRDALGELTNMVGGNIKALLAGTEYLSLPTVIEGSDYGVARLASDTVAKTQGFFENQSLQVVLLADQG